MESIIVKIFFFKLRWVVFGLFFDVFNVVKYGKVIPRKLRKTIKSLGISISMVKAEFLVSKVNFPKKKKLDTTRHIPGLKKNNRFLVAGNFCRTRLGLSLRV